MIGYIKNNDVNSNINKNKKIIAVYDNSPTPVPSKGDHYTAQLNYTAVITQVETKEVDT